MQESALQYGEITFQSKVIPLFLPKCSKFHHLEMYTIHSILYTLYGSDCRFLPYMVEIVRKKKKGKTWRNEVDTKTVKIATCRDSFLNIEKDEFHYILYCFA